MSIRVFDREPPAPGELVLARDAGGWRHYLDGRPVSCGSALEMFIPDDGPGFWVPGRYESTLNGPDCQASFLGEVAGLFPVSHYTVLRWPAKRKGRGR